MVYCGINFGSPLLEHRRLLDEPEDFTYPWGCYFKFSTSGLEWFKSFIPSNKLNILKSLLEFMAVLLKELILIGEATSSGAPLVKVRVYFGLSCSFFKPF